MNNIYKSYYSDELVTTPKKTLYQNSLGFLNEKAMNDFISRIEAKHNYFLTCINVDITASNENMGYEFGTRVLRQVYKQLSDTCYVFHLGGTKFNLFAPLSEIENVNAMLNSSVEKLFMVYYGNKRKIVTSENYEETRRICVERMYQHMANKQGKKINEVRDDVIVGDKGNTPIELQETDTKKYIDTMYFGEILLSETKPSVREVKVWVFVTEYLDKMQSVNQIVVVDDLVRIRLFSGKNVEFGFDGIPFRISSRFDSNGKLAIMCFQEKSRGECGIKIEAHEGVCIPANFGKRLENGLELFPVKPTQNGTYSCVVWNKNRNKAEYNEDGVIDMRDGKYAVVVNDKEITLVKH